MMRTIKINLSFAPILNGIAIILAMIGTLSPVWVPSYTMGEAYS